MVSAPEPANASRTYRRDGDLAQADNATVRNVADVTLAEERKQVMLAETERLDVPDDDHFV
jgi:hypothetical protein